MPQHSLLIYRIPDSNSCEVGDNLSHFVLPRRDRTPRAYFTALLKPRLSRLAAEIPGSDILSYSVS